jgi:hypothetical protein
MKDLISILNEDELHLMYILLNKVKFQVRVGRELGEEITTNIGGPQGDCLSAILFTFYPAKSLKYENEEQEHSYAMSATAPSMGDVMPVHLKDHDYAQRFEHLEIDQQYADDTGWATTNIGIVNYVKRHIPTK